MVWGRGDARQADRPIFQMYRAAPKGAAWLSIPCTSHWHYRTAGGEEEEEEGVHTQTKSSLALPLFVSSDQ